MRIKTLYGSNIGMKTSNYCTASKRLLQICFCCLVIAFPLLGLPSPAQNDTEITILRKPVELPNLPMYTGKCHFLGGQSELHAKGGPRYRMCFQSEDSQSDILSWYANTFVLYRWKIEQRTSSTIASYYKNGDYCVVQTSKATIKSGKDKCTLTIQFAVNQP